MTNSYGPFSNFGEFHNFCVRLHVNVTAAREKAVYLREKATQAQAQAKQSYDLFALSLIIDSRAWEAETAANDLEEILTTFLNSLKPEAKEDFITTYQRLSEPTTEKKAV